MVEEFVRNHTVLVAVVLGVSFIVDLTYTAMTRGVGQFALSFLAMFTSICILFAAAYGFITPELFNLLLTLCTVVYVFNRLLPARRV